MGILGNVVLSVDIGTILEMHVYHIITIMEGSL